MNELLRRWLGEPLDDDTAKAFAKQSSDTSASRLRALLPLMAVVHVVHAIAYHVPAAERAGVDATVLAWKDGVVAVHLATLALNVVLAAVAWSKRANAFVAVATAALYLAHGAACAGFDQLVVKNTNAYTGYAFGIAVVLALTPRQALAGYVVGVVTFVAALVAYQPDDNLRTSALLNGVTASVVGVGLSLLLHVARRRDFAQRMTIDRQKRELASLNQALEKRVQDQVQEIVKRADEVQALNTQLQARVRDRSNELSIALAKLALRRGAEGVLSKGTVLGDRFEIDALLGSGGMGAVYAGIDRTTSAKVAIKVIQAASARQLDALHRFLREAKSAATITHPAVVRALHVDIADDGLLYQVQELVVGKNLEEWLHERGRADAGICARIGGVLCDALAAAHEAGVVHRDVKPSNAMLTKLEPGLKLLDFGIATQLMRTEADAEGAAISLGTDRGFVVGTPAYMAPEQHTGDEITGGVDVYAAGTLLYRMAAGRLPKEQRTQKVRHSTPQPAQSEPIFIDIALGRIVERCRARDPDERPTARELAQELNALADEKKAPALTSLL